MEIKHFQHQYAIPPATSGHACVEVFTDGSNRTLKRKEVKEVVFQAALEGYSFISIDEGAKVYRLLILSPADLLMLQSEMS